MRARVWRYWAALLGVVFLLAEAGCGSVLYVNQVTRKASASVAAAEAAEAPTYAPYHYHLAVHYLRKAREEAAAADYQAANRFGERSYEAAETARELAVDRASNPTDVLWKPPPGTPGYAAEAAVPNADEEASDPKAQRDDGDNASGEAAPNAAGPNTDADATGGGDSDAQGSDDADERRDDAGTDESAGSDGDDGAGSSEGAR